MSWTSSEIYPLLTSIVTSDLEKDVRRSSVFALAKVGVSLEGARAVADAHAPARAVAHLCSPNLELRKFTCHIMLHLAKHPPALPAVLASNPCAQLLVLVRSASYCFFFLALALNAFSRNSDGNLELRQQALAALARISCSPDGAAGVVEAQVTAKAAQILYDPHPKIRAETSLLLGNLALHARTVAAVVSIDPYARLLSFLRYEVT